jgi:hypothetical protein
MSKKEIIQKETPDLFGLLKLLGFKLESTINKYIQDSLNKEEIAVTANSVGQVLAHIIVAVNEYVEQLSSQLNFPTKNDVSRLGKLIIQSEDKIDGLEDEIHEVLNLLKEIKMNLLDSLKVNAVQLSEDLDGKIKKELSELIKDPTGHLQQEVVKPIEELETKLKKKLGNYSEGLAKTNTDEVKKELQMQLMKPSNQVDLNEINNQLRKLLIEKRSKKWGGKHE